MLDLLFWITAGFGSLSGRSADPAAAIDCLNNSRVRTLGGLVSSLAAVL